MSEPSDQPDSEPVNLIQRWFASVITHPDGVQVGLNSDEAQRLIRLAPNQLESIVTRSRQLTAAERLAIYANAYHTRLLDCLGDVFPILKRALGEEAFNGFAFGYLHSYPSRSYTLNELGRHFPRYLEETRPSTTPDGDSADTTAAPEDSSEVMEDWPDFLIDLARLEWAIYEIFDGPGVEGQSLLQADQLLDFPRDLWPQARLRPVPCLKLLTSRFPVNDYYGAARQATDSDPVEIPSAAESYVALTRREFIVRRYNLSRPEFVLLQAIADGTTLGEAIERAASETTDDVATLAGKLTLWFRNWTAEGFFQSIEA